MEANSFPAKLVGNGRRRVALGRSLRNCGGFDWKRRAYFSLVGATLRKWRCVPENVKLTERGQTWLKKFRRCKRHARGFVPREHQA